MSDNNEFRDWRGVLEYADVPKHYKSSLKHSLNKEYIKPLIYRWNDTKESTNHNIESLQKILQQIDRFDIYHDTLSCFGRLENSYFKSY